MSANDNAPAAVTVEASTDTNAQDKDSTGRCGRLLCKAPCSCANPAPQRQTQDPEAFAAEAERAWSSPEYAASKAIEALKATLLATEKGFRACGSNIYKILTGAPEMRGNLRFNELTKQVEIAGGGPFAGKRPNDLVPMIANWLETEWGVFARTSTVSEQLLLAARTIGSYDPIAEYLNGLEWDRQDRIGTWLVDYCGADPGDDTDGEDPYNGLGSKNRKQYLRLVGRRFLIAAVARALNPGCKVDTVLVLEGPQGLKKSMAMKALASDAWFSDTPFQIGDKDGLMAAGATWFCELAELAALIKSSTAAQKAFLSSATDKYRPPYGRVQEEFPRRSIFVGTVNPEDGHVDYLTDKTGSRRWWPVRVGTINVTKLKQDRDQIWAEACWYYKQSLRRGDLENQSGDQLYRWWFTAQEQKLLDRVTESRQGDDEDVYADAIDKWWVKRWRDLEKLGRNPRTEGFALADVAKDAINVPLERVKRVEKALGKSLRKAGFVKREDGPGRNQRWFSSGPDEPDDADTDTDDGAA